MSISDARLTQSGGLRGLQADSNRVTQDYEAAPGGGGAAELIQWARAGDNTGTGSVAFSGNLTNPTTLVVAANMRRTSTAPSISDTGSHTWTSRGLQGPFSSGFLDLYTHVWTAPNTGTGSCTVSLSGWTGSSGNFWQLVAFEVTGAYESVLVEQSSDAVSLGASTGSVGDDGLAVWTIFYNGIGTGPPWTLSHTAVFNVADAVFHLGGVGGGEPVDTSATLTVTASETAWWTGAIVVLAAPV